MEPFTKGDVVNRLVDAFGLQSYLEYNKFDGATYYADVRCAHKEAAYLPEESFLDAKRIKRLLRIASEVDLDRIMSLETLVRRHPVPRFDVIFFDPVHVRPDVDLALRALPRLLRPGGFLAVHDCNPPNAAVTAIPRPDGAWFGETYKAFCIFRQANPRQTLTVDTDCGVGIVCNDGLDLDYDFNQDFDYDDFDRHRIARLGLIDLATFLQRTQAGTRDALFVDVDAGPAIAARPRASMSRRAPAPRRAADPGIEAQLFWAGAETPFSGSRCLSRRFAADDGVCRIEFEFPPGVEGVARLRWDFADCPVALQLIEVELHEPDGGLAGRWSHDSGVLDVLRHATAVRTGETPSALYLVSQDDDPQMRLKLPAEQVARIGPGWRVVVVVAPQRSEIFDLLAQLVRSGGEPAGDPLLCRSRRLDADETRLLNNVRSLALSDARKRAAIDAFHRFYAEWAASTGVDPRMPAVPAAPPAAAARTASTAAAGARPERRTNVLVVGRAKTGTTVISTSIANSLGEHDFFMEPKDVAFFCERPNARSNVVKVIHEHWGDRARLFAAIAANELPLKFDRTVLIRRDVRDEMISRMLYVAFPWCEAGMYDDGVAGRWLGMLREKEDDPRGVPLRALVEFQREHMNCDPTALPYLGDYIDLLRRPPAGAHIVGYEDFVDGRIEALEAYLGHPLQPGRDVGAEHGRTLRSGGHGSWKHYLCADDVDYFRALVGGQASALGYDDWTISDAPRIPRETCSLYVERLFAEAQRRFGVPAGVPQARP